MKAILIDAVNRLVKEVETVGGLDEMYALIGCDMVEAVDIDRRNSVYVDEESLCKSEPPPHWFLLEGYAQPLAGNGLVLGLDRSNGETVGTTFTAEQIQAKVKFMNLGEVRECFAS